MLELICHHTYDTWNGLGIDRSPYGLSNGDHEGQDVEYRQDGRSPGSGAVYVGPDSRVAVRPSPAWASLGAVRAELTVRLEQARDYAWRALLDADDSFRIWVGTSPADLTSAVFASVVDPHAPSGYHAVSTRVDEGAWYDVAFEYDGLGNLRLFLGGDLVDEKAVGCDVRPVGPGGVAIGGLTGGSPTYSALAEFDEVKIWRRDPQEIPHDFLGRPYDPDTARCWARAAQAMTDVVASDPARFVPLLDYFRIQLHEVERRVVGTGPDGRAAFDDLHRRYLELWKAGALDTDEMEALFADLAAWWRDRVGGSPGDNGAFREILDGLLPPFDGAIDLSCDSQLGGFLTRLTRAVRS